MSLDRHAAERRRFARLLGTDGELGCGLPIGSDSSQTAKEGPDRDRHERNSNRSTGDGDGDGDGTAVRSRD